MKNVLVATLLVSLVGAAAAQSVITPAMNSTVSADRSTTEAARQQLRGDRAKKKADRQRLKADEASGNTAAVASDKATLSADRAAYKQEKSIVGTDHSDTEGARSHNHTTAPIAPAPVMTNQQQ